MSNGSDRHDVVHVIWFWSTRCCSRHMGLIDTMLFMSHGSDRHDVVHVTWFWTTRYWFMSNGSGRHDVGSCHMVLVDMMLIHVTWFWST
ncbi:hypothetical protein RRG08_013820 [Elysia crispata]|uniref:Uncharacterized protein n=1 Tax=Elysia crispata TaxID=231223 RepID=A0AAE1EDT0_9GAST|nr:hypothetical protein RRG08_013820 [Elysia crispata]